MRSPSDEHDGEGAAIINRRIKDTAPSPKLSEKFLK
jgi:hypothetical protein